jgi:HlyD family secretion protein
MEKQGKDLSVLRIDPSRKGSFDSKGKAPWSPLIYVGAGVLLVLIVVAAASGFLTSAPEVEVQRVGLERLTGGATGGSVVLTAGGYIVAHHTIQVSSKIIGRVAWVGIEKGDQVQEGQVLVRLEDAEYQAQLSQARANLEVARARLQELERGSRPQEVDASRASAAEAEATFNNAAVNLKRVENLAKNDVASQQQLDNARTQYEVAKAQLESARKRFDLVKIGPREEQIAYARAQAAQAQAAVDYAQTMQNSTLIRAPVSGTVLERSIEKGELVTTMNFGGTGGVKASVCSLADLKDLQVELDINQNDFPRISPRQECQVTADAYPDRTYKGVVEEIAPQANRQKATIQVKVKIQEPDSFLRPEMNAHVSFFAPAQESKKSAESSRETLVIPRSAIVQSDGKPAVFVLDGSRVQLKQIEVGREIGDRAEVADGLGPNDRIVTKGLEGLSTGQRVRVKQGS